MVKSDWHGGGWGEEAQIVLFSVFLFAQGISLKGSGLIWEDSQQSTRPVTSYVT